MCGERNEKKKFGEIDGAQIQIPIPDQWCISSWQCNMIKMIRRHKHRLEIQIKPELKESELRFTLCIVLNKSTGGEWKMENGKWRMKNEK